MVCPSSTLEGGINVKSFVRCVVLAASMFAGAGLVACSGGTGSNPPAPPSNAPATSATPSVADIGGSLVWQPDATEGSGQCPNPKEIAAGGSGAALTIKVKADVTYVDLQLPQQLQGLTGLQVGDDFVVIPRSMFEAHVSSVELGNQFDKRGADDVRSCWAK